MAGSIITPKTKIQRRLGVITYQAGTKQQLRLDQDGVLLETRLRLRYTVTNGGSAAVLPRPFALARLIKRLEMTANGSDTFINQDGAHLVARAQIERGCRLFGMDATVVLTASTATTYEIVIPIQHTLPRAVRPDDAGVDMRALNQCILSIDWGDANDIYGTPNGATISNVTCSIEGTFYGFPGKDDRYLVRDLNMQIQDVAATNSDLGTIQDRGDFYYRSFNILAVSDNVLVNTLLTSGAIRLVSGSYVFADRSGPDLLADQAGEYNLPLAERMTGVYRLELPTTGQGTTMIRAKDLSADLYLRFNVAKVGTTDQLLISRETLRTWNL